jgi:hypothetical protein
VSDEDGDAVTVLYRIGDDVTWSVLATSSEVNVLPADLVSRLVSKPEVQKIEVTAFDGLDVSDEWVTFAPPGVVNSEWDVAYFPDGLMKFAVRLGDIRVDNCTLIVCCRLNTPRWFITKPLQGNSFVSLPNLRFSARIIGSSSSSSFNLTGAAKLVQFQLRQAEVSHWPKGNYSIQFSIAPLGEERRTVSAAFRFGVTSGFRNPAS